MQIGKFGAILILLLLCFSLNGQTRVHGTVKDSLGKVLPYTSIIAMQNDSTSIVAYTYTKDNGDYEIILENKGSYKLIASLLGFQKITKSIEITNYSKEISENFILTESAVELKEVIVASKLPIKIGRDTITFNVSSYLRGNETVVEDLLKNLPGVNVDDEGRISVGNQEIERLMVDGDDLFEKGYSILSKNLPVHPIETVELLKRYSNNKLLKGIEDSDRVAINLKLKENAKNIWFGNIILGYDTQLRSNYSAKLNLANFNKKAKYYFLGNLNNLGDNATGDLNKLMKPNSVNKPGNIGDDQSPDKLISFTLGVPNLKPRRTNFNNEELASLNTIFNLSDKAKLKTLLFYNGDENQFFRNRTQNFIGNETNFTNNEFLALKKTQHNVFSKFDFGYEVAENKSFETAIKFNFNSLNDISDLAFNALLTTEGLESNNNLFDQKIIYTNRFDSSKAFILSARYINERSPQNYVSNQFLFEDLFPSDDAADNIAQVSEIKYQFVGAEAHLFDRKKNGSLLELKIGNKLRVDSLNTSFRINNNSGMLLSQPTGFQNALKYTTNDLYFKSKYLFKLKKFEFIGSLDFHQLSNKIESLDTDLNQSLFFINPQVGINYELNSANKFRYSTSYTTTNAGLLDVTDNFYLNSFRTFSEGLGRFNQLNSSNHFLSYSLGDWGNRFFANLLVNYRKDHDFLSYNTSIDQNFSLSKTIMIDDRQFFNTSGQFDYFLKGIRNNIKLNVGYSKSDFKNIINDSDLREVNTKNYTYGATLRSGFKSKFNYHIGFEWYQNDVLTSGQKNTFTNSLGFADIMFKLNDRLSIDLSGERYYFNQLGSNDEFYFLDIKAQLKLINNKVTLFLDGRNLLDTDEFRSFSISDISTSSTTYRLLPRFILLKVNYQF